MDRRMVRAQRLTALFFLALFLFSVPALALFNRMILVGGMPLLHLYLYGAWLAVIIALALLLHRMPWN